VIAVLQKIASECDSERISQNMGPTFDKVHVHVNIWFIFLTQDVGLRCEWFWV